VALPAGAATGSAVRANKRARGAGFGSGYSKSELISAAAEICSINFPARPRYMGRERYDRLRQLHNEASQRALGMFAVQLSRLSESLRR
jgi:hypothetical protein